MMVRQKKSILPLPLRVVALAVLFLAVLFLSGSNFSALAVSPSQPAPLAACCPSFSPAEEWPAPPCQDQDCPCLFCLTLPPARLAESVDPPLFTSPLFAPLLPRPLAAFVRRLDYPPERV